MPTRPNSGPHLDFPDGPGEGLPLPAMMLRSERVVDLAQERISAICSCDDYLVVATTEPPSLLTIPWESFYTSTHASIGSSTSAMAGISRTPLRNLSWLVDHQISITAIAHSPSLQTFAFVTSCGRVYNARETSKVTVRGIGLAGQNPKTTTQWRGSCLHGMFDSTNLDEVNGNDGLQISHPKTDDKIGAEPQVPSRTPPQVSSSQRAVTIAINARFSMIAVGMQK